MHNHTSLIAQRHAWLGVAYLMLLLSMLKAIQTKLQKTHTEVIEEAAPIGKQAPNRKPTWVTCSILYAIRLSKHCCFLSKLTRAYVL